MLKRPHHIMRYQNRRSHTALSTGGPCHIVGKRGGRQLCEVPHDKSQRLLKAKVNGISLQR